MLITLLLCLLCCCCQSDTQEGATELTLSKMSLSFTKEGGAEKFALKSNRDWSITSSESWCRVEIDKGAAGVHQMNVTVDKSDETELREADLTITSAELTEVVKVTQDPTFMLSIPEKSYDVNASGETIQIMINASDTPTFESDLFWLQQGEISQVQDGFTVDYKIDPNLALLGRVANVTVSVGDVTQSVTITQGGQPLNINADKSEVTRDAKELAKKIKLGWNLGNSLEAYSGGVPSETAWGNPKTTKSLIDLVKNSGFNAVRIPCAWSGYIVDEESYKISDEWFARVKEVVDYCVDNDMYVIINIHWDGGWLENNPTYDKQEAINIKQKALWEQIAVYFRDYGEQLLFAGTNEVHFDYNTPTQEHSEVQLSFNQTFVDAVRSTGGRNTWRNIIIQAYNTNINHAVTFLKGNISTDPTPNRLMVEVHYYDPYDFALQEEGGDHLWGASFIGRQGVSNWGQEDYVDDSFGKMKCNFVDAGYPVILGEYGAMRRSSLTGVALEEHNESRANYLEYVTKVAKNNGIIPFYWDNGGLGDSSFGLFNRNTNQVYDAASLEALVSGAESGIYPF